MRRAPTGSSVRESEPPVLAGAGERRRGGGGAPLDVVVDSAGAAGLGSCVGCRGDCPRCLVVAPRPVVVAAPGVPLGVVESTTPIDLLRMRNVNWRELLLRKRNNAGRQPRGG